jgi:predicted acetyltransferase
MILLRKPSIQDNDEITKFKSEFSAVGENRIPGSGGLERYEDFQIWIASLDLLEAGLIPETVPTSIFLVVNTEDHVVGTISLRHYLTSDLEEFGGHIGYAIKPSERCKGYAKEALQELLRTKASSYPKLWIMCEEDNEPSKKVIQDNHGVFMSRIKRFDKIINRYLISSSVNNSE